ncbi:phenylalanine--tRNA ligase subunit beta [Thermaurantiacus tibetensis]|uniref:phenylalanine--tRNA ligase subunit beta n=1 Tax=Thermaurantiacus tibetensis TaxID=2759035 RepID=UPI00188E4C3D|nr:phenylalanine--tRNA ligase subunit beta [Thermaurantiacus tibetensis]
MKVPLSWLRRYLETDADAAAIADALTRLGLEVEGIANPAERLAPFTIARVLTAERHPQADRLQVLTVDAGIGEAVQVVCGAPNARAGLVGVFAPPGTHVPGIDLTLKVSSIRGVESRGMMCSARELELGDDHEGIIELPEDAPVGAAYARWAGLDDPVIEVAVTPNRADCMGIFGIARDLAAARLGRLVAPEVPTLAPAFPCPVPIAIEDAEGCPAFFARALRGVRNGPSPQWLKDLLTRAGLRPVSALVDVTNYMSLGFGRPLHVYDIARLRGGLTARRARPGETLLALNGRTYALDESMCVIADEAAVHDIGGIMGGMDSGVSEETTDVLVEAAWFSPARIGATGRALGIVSDARARFERGVDPAFVGPGLDLAVAMMQALCGGEVSEAACVGAPPALDRVIRFAPETTARLSGLDVPAAEQREILARLGFAVDGDLAGDWAVRVPSWRRDVEGPADLVEEVVRLVGLDRVAAVPLPREPGVAKPVATPAQMQERRVRRALAARGLDEAVTWSFIAEAEAERFGGAAHRLVNPLSAELAVMRPSLLPGLLAAARRNMARGERSVRLFELGRRYLAEGERPTAGLLLAGDAEPRHWKTGKARPADAFDAKAAALAALAAAGAPVERLATRQPGPAWYHPGRSAELVLGKAVLAAFGELHPALAGDVGAVAAAELFLDAVPASRGKRPPYRPSPLMPVRRDFAFLVPETLPAEALLRAVAGADRALVAEVELFDRFTGPGVPEGQVSLAIGVTLQPRERTLAEADLAALAEAVEAAAAKLGAVLRG